MQNVQKGTVSSVEGNGTARVIPNISGGAVTRPLTIPQWLRGKGNLSPGIEVVYCVFEDGTGIILTRMDGDTPGGTAEEES